jgi:hypothetical protein
MFPLAGISAWAARLVLYGLLAAALAFAVRTVDKGRQQIGFDRAMVAVQAAADKAAAANRTRARAAEVRYVAVDRVRVETVKEVITEVQHETDNLAACKLDAGDVRVLNAAASRIGALGAAPGAADAGLPAPRPAD